MGKRLRVVTQCLAAGAGLLGKQAEVVGIAEHLLEEQSGIFQPSRIGLAADGLVCRYDPAVAPDGLPGREGTFNMCSFWLVEALTRAGRTDPARLEDARLLFEQMLGYANHLGLYAEQTGNSGEALGNFPQAFTHLALISAAFNLDRALGSPRVR